ncbi:MAG: response regulator transcription factor [Anaerolineaceae bacterium]|nr:response regulator transcription factor [Anaerolineaceae bacterium]
MDNIKLLLVDDHPVVRKGMRAMLETEADLSVVGEGTNGEEAVRQYAQLKPDVVLMDLVMPVMDGVQAIREIIQQDPGARILVLTSFSSDDKVFAAINAGAAGYLLKDSDPDDLIRAIHQVKRGESSLHPAVARKLLSELTHSRTQQPEPEPLTEREKEVLTYIAQGLSNQEISEKMVVSRATVHSHVSRILSKLQLDSRTQAALYAIRAGYITIGYDSQPGDGG